MFGEILITLLQLLPQRTVDEEVIDEPGGFQKLLIVLDNLLHLSNQGVIAKKTNKKRFSIILYDKQLTFN